MYTQKKSPWYTVKRFALIILGSILMAVNINTFISAGGLIPGGLNGLTLLIQEICLRYGGIKVPFSIIVYVLNVVPAVFCFKFIGKKFTIYSCIVVILSGLLVDWMPSMFIDFLRFHDTLLSAVFGGLLNALVTALCLHADATSGGTDFIAIYISEKFRKDAWNYIFAGNCVILAVAGYLFSLEKALYSIIFQFTTTAALSVLYRSYQQKTMLIITNKSDEIYTLIRDVTNHGATSFKGIGHYQMAERVLLYSVVSASEVAELITAIKKIDPDAFINILKTETLNGRFYMRPKD
ncbi:UPF0750 membrane protein YitT [Spirochaetia bacterium]|nr:UPF0750 membrane protein YitT [Spirochaetia bacterium]